MPRDPQNSWKMESSKGYLSSIDFRKPISLYLFLDSLRLWVMELEETLNYVEHQIGDVIN